MEATQLGRPSKYPSSMILHLSDVEEISGLDSSLKKNTAFIRRLKNIMADNYKLILSEFAGLRLTKYLEEAAGSICENRFKSTGDYAATIEVNKRQRTFLNVFIR